MIWAATLLYNTYYLLAQYLRRMYFKTSKRQFLEEHERMGEGEEKKGEMKWHEEKSGSSRDVVSFVCLCYSLI